MGGDGGARKEKLVNFKVLVAMTLMDNPDAWPARARASPGRVKWV